MPVLTPPPPPQVYAVLLSSFLWFAFRSGCSLDRRGKYTLSRRYVPARPPAPTSPPRVQTAAGGGIWVLTGQRALPLPTPGMSLLPPAAGTPGPVAQSSKAGALGVAGHVEGGGQLESCQTSPPETPLSSPHSSPRPDLTSAVSTSTER